MQVSQHPQYSQWDQRNASFVPPTRLVPEHTRDLSPPATPGMSPPPPPPHTETLASPQRPNTQNRQSTGFFSAFSRSKSASSGQILSPPATPAAAVQERPHQQAPQQHAQPAPVQHANTPPPRVQASTPSGTTHSTTASPNPEAAIPGRTQPVPPLEEPKQTQQQQQQQHPAPHSESPFALSPTGVPLHSELRSVLRLNTAHQRKVYYSGRLSKRVERGTDGTRPTKDEGWIDIWCQLGGVTLSIWNMKAIEEANARGEQVPPQYVNITDAFVQVLGSVTFPATPTTPAKRFTNVLTLNTAGSNLLLFVCESPAALVSWAAALRLASWERSRLEEIYTAHLLRITLTESRVWKEPRTTLVKGQLEGWARVRVAGQTDWKRLWVVISAGSPNYQPPGPTGTSVPGGHRSDLSLTQTRSRGEASVTTPKKGRLSGLFSRSHQHTNSNGSTGSNTLTRPNPNSPGGANGAPMIYFYSSTKPKERKTPVLSVSGVSQAFAVYPERPDLITRSTLVKIEGRLGKEEGAGAIKGTEAWVLVMPEVESGQTAGPRKMLEWVVALHDAFRLYGRPNQYSFNPHNTVSLMFAYPVDPNVDQLFLDRELAESLDPREDATSVTRSRLTAILSERMRKPLTRNNSKGQTQPQNATQNQQLDVNTPATSPGISGSGRQPATGGRGPALTPITERSTTGETRAYTVGESAHQQNPSGGSGGGEGNVIQQGAMLVKSPIEEEEEQGGQRISSLWGGNGPLGGETREMEAQARGGEGRGARPMSMALGAMNVEGPGATGANATAHEHVVAPETCRSVSSPGPGHNQSALGHNHPQNALGLGTNTSMYDSSAHSHGPTSPSYSSPDSKSALTLGTGVPEPGALDLRAADVEHRPGNGHAQSYGGAHIYGNGPSSLAVPSTQMPGDASPKPVLTPIRTTALSPPPRNVTRPSPGKVENLLEQPASPPAGAQEPNRHASMSSGEGFIPSEAARFILDHEGDESAGGLGLTGTSGSGVRAALPGQRKTFESSSEDEEEEEEDPVQRAVVQPWQKDAAPSPIHRQSTPMAFSDMGFGAGPSRQQDQPAPAPEPAPAPVHKPSMPQPLYASPEPMTGTPPPPVMPAAQPVTPATRSVLPSSQAPTIPRPLSGYASSGSRNLGRKPSGARAPPVKTPRVAKTTLAQHPIPDDDEHTQAVLPPPLPPLPQQQPQPQPEPEDMADDLGADALAALSFAERDHRAPSPPPPPRHVQDYSPSPSSSPAPASVPRPPRQQLPTLGVQQPQQQGPAYRSSFAPSKHAAERKAKAQASQVAADDAMKRPGRANGKKPKSSMASSRSGAWESSDEEDDAAEPDEDASDNEDNEPLRNRSGPPSGTMHAQTNVLAPQPQQQQQLRGAFLGSANGSWADLHANTPPGARPLPSPDAHPPSQGRPPRGLPALPQHPGSANSHDNIGQGRPYAQSSGPHSRAPSQGYDDRDRGYAYADEQPQYAQSNLAQQQQPYRGAYRQTIWNSTLDPNNRSASPANGNKDTFVQINPNETMTKAFTPQGLLQAGLQDKHDRSAKRQEELAREAGASLLNVPNKPPPPQTGLLGAVTAHERDRKRDGGLGAVLTEREREKRLAEERQRKIDELQRQQLEHQQSIYGGSPGPMNPMMMNPMMTGMGMPNMGMMGYNPMMGFDPQQQFQMWAAQQAAAEAYQRAMMTFSQAGSVGPGQQQEDGRGASPMPGQWGMMGMGMGVGMPGMMNPMMGMNPMMTGGGMSMMPPGFGGSQFGGMGGMGGMPGMGAMSQMGGMGTPSQFQGQGQGQGQVQGGSPAPARTSEDLPLQNGNPAAGGSGQH